MANQLFDTVISIATRAVGIDKLEESIKRLENSKKFSRDTFTKKDLEKIKKNIVGCISLYGDVDKFQEIKIELEKLLE